MSLSWFFFHPHLHLHSSSFENENTAIFPNTTFICGKCDQNMSISTTQITSLYRAQSRLSLVFLGHAGPCWASPTVQQLLWCWTPYQLIIVRHFCLLMFVAACSCLPLPAITDSTIKFRLRRQVISKRIRNKTSVMSSKTLQLLWKLRRPRLHMGYDHIALRSEGKQIMHDQHLLHLGGEGGTGRSRSQSCTG